MPDLLFVRVAEGKQGKNRLHLDLRPVRPGRRSGPARGPRGIPRHIGQDENVTWVVMADPDGNEFCVLRALTAEELARVATPSSRSPHCGGAIARAPASCGAAAKEVEAVRGVDFEVERGELFGLLGPERRRQDDHHQDAHHAAAADLGHRRGSWVTTWSTTPREVRRRVGYVFGGDRGLYERLSALDNLRYFAELYGVPAREQPGADRRAARARRARPAARRSGSRATRAACGSGCTSPAACCTAPRCCSSTSRRSASTRSAPVSCASTVAGLVERGHHRAAHHALHVRGRRAVRPHRGHRRRPHRRGGHARPSSSPGSRRGRSSRSRSSGSPERRARGPRRCPASARPSPSERGHAQVLVVRANPGAEVPQPVLGCLDGVPFGRVATRAANARGRLRRAGARRVTAYACGCSRSLAAAPQDAAAGRRSTASSASSGRCSSPPSPS